MADLRLVSINLFWRQSRERKIKDINDVKGQADIICFQECYNSPVRATLGSGWNFHQGEGPGNEDNAIAWRTDRAKLVDKGYHFIAKLDAAKNKTFKIAWARFLIDGEKRLVVGSTHPPHGGYTRYDSGLYGRCMDGTAEWWRKHADWGNIIIGGDWNKQLSSDPGNLSGRLPAVWSGGDGVKAEGHRGIDGFLRHQHINRTRHYSEGLHSDHPAIYIHVTPNSINKSGGGGSSNPDPKPEPRPVRTPPLHLGSYNVKYTSDPKVVVSDLRDTVFKKSDVVGLQEVAWATPLRHGIENEIEGNWGWHQQGSQGSDSPILWRKSEFEALEKGAKKLTDSRDRDGSDSQKRWATYVKLKHKASGQRFWVINCHLQAFGYKAAHAARKIQLGEVRDLYNDLAKGAIPVFLIGDLNTREPFKDGLGGGLRSPFDRIDHVVYDPDDAKLLDHGTVASTNLISDHPFVWAELRVTSGIPTGGDGDGDGTGGGGGGGGGSDGGSDPEPPEEVPTPPKQPAEPDTGHNEDIDHDDCCGGTEVP